MERIQINHFLPSKISVFTEMCELALFAVERQRQMKLDGKWKRVRV